MMSIYYKILELGDEYNRLNAKTWLGRESKKQEKIREEMEVLAGRIGIDLKICICGEK